MKNTLTSSIFSFQELKKNDSKVLVQTVMFPNNSTLKKLEIEILNRTKYNTEKKRKKEKNNDITTHHQHLRITKAEEIKNRFNTKYHNS